MHAIVKFVLALLEVLEGEAAALRRSVLRLVIGIGLAVVASVLLVSASGCFVWAVYAAFAPLVGRALGAVCAGGVATFGAGVFLWVATRMAR